MSEYLTNVEKLSNFDPFSLKTGISVEDIKDFYVPFDEMLNHNQIEQKLIEEFQKDHPAKFFGIMGESGSGKSSILNYLMSYFSNEGKKVFCIKVRSFSEIKSPRDLLHNIVKIIYDMSTQFVSLEPEQKEEAKKVLSNQYTLVQRKEKGAKLGIRAWYNIIPLIAGIEGSVSASIKTQSEVITHGNPTVNDLTTYLDQIVSILQEKAGMKHIIIMIDETDKIRGDDGKELSIESAIKYFNENLPVLEGIRCSYIFVMNAQYNNDEFRSHVNDRFAPIMMVPPLTKKESIQKIIEKRTQAACGSVSFDDVWEQFTIDLLFEHYNNAKVNKLRSLTQLCNLAVQYAKSEGSETISQEHILNARLDMTN